MTRLAAKLPTPVSRRAVLVGLSAALAGCRVEFGPPGEGKVEPGLTGEVWVYTSMYESVLAGLKPIIAEKYPKLQVKWFQGGSEKVAARIEAEWAAGGSPADLILISDPFWYEQAKRHGKLLRHASPESLRLPREYLDLDGYWATCRLSVMVMTVNGEKIPPADRPRAFMDLSSPSYKDRVSSGDPLASGTTLTWMAFLQKKHGWEHFRALRANGLVAAGGNSAVLTRVESGEKPVGVILLENLLAARAHATPAVPLFPVDGAVVIPGPVAILKDGPNPEAARALQDLFLSPEGQAEIIKGNMYSPRPDLPPPAGAPPWGSFPVQPWSEEFLQEVVDGKKGLLEGYAQIMAESRGP